MLTRFLLTAFLFTSFAGFAAHGEPAAAERILELEQENDRLRTELAELRLELSKLKRSLEQEATKTKEADPKTKAEDAPVPDGEGEVKDADKPEEPRTYRSADEIYRSIPAEFKPKKDGWENADRKAVANWLTENMAGCKYEARKKIASVGIRQDYGNRELWVVTLSFEEKPMRYMGWEMQEKVSRYVMTGDDQFLKKMQKEFRKGTTVTLTGTITGTGWNYAGLKLDQNWHPTYCQINLKDMEVR